MCGCLMILGTMQYVAMEVINPEHIDCTLEQIGGNERVKKDLVRHHVCLGASGCRPEAFACTSPAVHSLTMPLLTISHDLA